MASCHQVSSLALSFYLQYMINIIAVQEGWHSSPLRLFWGRPSCFEQKSLETPLIPIL